MADSAVAITAGAGTNIDTRTETTNSNHRQVVVIGDPATNAGVAPVDVTNGLSVTLTTAIPAGTAAIGKLAANSGVDIGDVDITSVVPGTGATNLGKAEDAAHTTGDVGVAALSVRQDTASALSGTDGDYQPIITDGSGRLHVNVGNTVTVGSHAVTNAGTFAVQVDGSALTALQKIDDPVLVDDAAFTPATSSVSMIGAEFDDTLPDSVDEGDAGAVRMSANRNLYSTLRDAAGNERGANVNASNQLSVSVDNNPVLGAGTNGIGKLTANSGVDIGDVDVTTVVPGTGATNLGKAEDAAHTSGDVGVMALGVRNDTPNAALSGTDLDYTPIATYRTGALRMAPPEEDFAALGSNSVKKYFTNAGAVTDGIVWSPAVGKRWYVTDIFLNVSAAATVTLEDDLVAGDAAVWKAELAANSGWSHSFSTPLFSGEDAADLLVTTSAANVYITITGYEI